MKGSLIICYAYNAKSTLIKFSKGKSEDFLLKSTLNKPKWGVRVYMKSYINDSIFYSQVIG